MKPLSRLLLFTLLVSTGKAVFAADQFPLWKAMERAAQTNPAIKSQQIKVSRQTLEQKAAREP